MPSLPISLVLFGVQCARLLRTPTPRGESSVATAGRESAQRIEAQLQELRAERLEMEALGVAW